jgi:hypothetical protein
MLPTWFLQQTNVRLRAACRAGAGCGLRRTRKISGENAD